MGRPGPEQISSEASVPKAGTAGRLHAMSQLIISNCRVRILLDTSQAIRRGEVEVGNGPLRANSGLTCQQSQLEIASGAK
jgi:hypothetical protein